MSHSTTSGGVRARRARESAAARRRRRAGHAAQRRAQVDRVPRARGPRAARAALAAAAARAARASPAPRASSSARHRREVLLLQHFARRERERRVELDLVLVVRRRVGVASAAASPARGARAARAAFGVRPRPSRAAAAPPSSARAARGLRQNRSNACSNSAQCSCRDTSTAASASRKSVAVRDAHRLDRRQRVEHLGGTDRQPGGAQHAHEVQHVLGEACRAAAPPIARGIAPRFTGECPRLHLGDEPRRDVGRERADVVLVLEQHAERVGDRLRIERDAVERQQRLAPSRSSRRRRAT